MLKGIFSTPVLFCILLFLAFPVCISLHLIDPYITPRVVLVAATVIVLTFLVFILKGNEIKFSPDVQVISCVIFLALFAASITKSINPGDALFEWMKSFTALPVMLLTAHLFQRDENRNMLLKFSQVCVLVLTSVYVYQWFYYLHHKNLELAFELKLHIASTLGNKNFYAEVICLLLPLSVISFFKFKRQWKLLSLFNIIVLLISLLLTQSFAALAALAVAALVVAAVYVYSGAQRKMLNLKTALFVIVFLLIGGFAVIRTGVVKNVERRADMIQQYLKNPGLIDSTARVNSNSTFERLMLWRNSFRLIRENPWTGCGAANWKLLYPKFGIGGTRYIEAGNVHYEHPHNDYLLIAAEAGIPALLAFLFFLFSLLWRSFRKLKKNDSHRLWFAGILFAAISFIIISIFSFPRVRFYGWVLLGIYAGLLLSLSSRENATVKKSLQSLWKVILLACAAISVWTLLAGFTRLNGEIHSMQMQVAGKQKNFARMVRESERASSFYFPVDETATPFSWYTGMALFYSGRVADAKAAYEDALTKNPYHIQLLNDLATGYEQTNERERAIELYRRALSVTPYFPHSLLNISACYFNLGKKDSAFLFIDKIYGIKLSYQEQKSYDVFLPAILREKIYSYADSFPGDVREKIIAAAADAHFTVPLYNRSRSGSTSFEKLLEDSVRKMR